MPFVNSMALDAGELGAAASGSQAVEAPQIGTAPAVGNDAYYNAKWLEVQNAGKTIGDTTYSVTPETETIRQAIAAGIFPNSVDAVRMFAAQLSLPGYDRIPKLQEIFEDVSARINGRGVTVEEQRALSYVPPAEAVSDADAARFKAYEAERAAVLDRLKSDAAAGIKILGVDSVAPITPVVAVGPSSPNDPVVAMGLQRPVTADTPTQVMAKTALDQREAETAAAADSGYGWITVTAIVLVSLWALSKLKGGGNG
jgi:hypothetical protein